MRRSARAVLAGALAAAAAGCGTGAEPGAQGVAVTVTRDFGAAVVGRARAEQVPAGETVMRFLQRHFDVETRYGGGFVQAIEGLAGERRGSRRVDWFFYVNGIESDQGAAAVALHGGDRVWWDRREWGGAMSIPAVVGQYPEPFKSGREGKRAPVRLDCGETADAACREVRDRLAEDGVIASRAAVGAASGIEVLRIVVGQWSEVRRDPTAVRLERGPRVSGVFARPHARGDAIDLLGPSGRRVRALGPGGGLVAATRYAEQQPTWVVTGTDAAGVEAAVDALSERSLQQRFAVAVEAGRPVRLPLGAR